MSAARARPTLAPVLPMLSRQSYAEFIKLFRVPAFSTTSIVLPAMLYLFIGLGMRSQHYAGVGWGTFYVASMALYGVANVMVLGFGISLANERGQKQDLLMQSTPMPAPVFFIAKSLSALVIALLALVALFALASVSHGANLPLSTWGTLALRAMLCSIPFIGLGFALGYLAGPNSAPAVTNLVYLPTAFASGLFYPLSYLPGFMQNIAPYLPLYRGAQLVWTAVGAASNGDPLTTDWLYMGAYTVAFFVLALWAYRRDQGRKFN